MTTIRESYILFVLAVSVLLVFSACGADNAQTEVEDACFTLNGKAYEYDVSIPVLQDNGWELGEAVGWTGIPPKHETTPESLTAGVYYVNDIYELKHKKGTIKVTFDQQSLWDGNDPEKCRITDLIFKPGDVDTFAFSGVELTALTYDELIESLGDPQNEMKMERLMLRYVFEDEGVIILFYLDSSSVVDEIYFHFGGLQNAG